jgi:hypothetical protein
VTTTPAIDEGREFLTGERRHERPARSTETLRRLGGRANRLRILLAATDRRGQQPIYGNSEQCFEVLTTTAYFREGFNLMTF